MSEDLWDYIWRWQGGEASYRESKFGLSRNQDLLRSEGVGPGTVWWDQIVSKLHRASVLGLDTPNGRQAAAKCAAAALALVEAAIAEYGLLPEPGVPSGGNLEVLMPIE